MLRDIGGFRETWDEPIVIGKFVVGFVQRNRSDGEGEMRIFIGLGEELPCPEVACNFVGVFEEVFFRRTRGLPLILLPGISFYFHADFC